MGVEIVHLVITLNFVERGGEMKHKYRIREGSFMDWFVSIAAPMAMILFIGLATGIVDYI